MQASSPPQLGILEPQAAANSYTAAAGGAVTPQQQQAVSSYPLRELSPDGSVADGIAVAGSGSALLTPRGTQEVRPCCCHLPLHFSSCCSLRARYQTPVPLLAYSRGNKTRHAVSHGSVENLYWPCCRLAAAILGGKTILTCGTALNNAFVRS